MTTHPERLSVHRESGMLAGLRISVVSPIPQKMIGVFGVRAIVAQGAFPMDIPNDVVS
jgi:hypothetical protein